jgi:hypothetical protein
MYFSTKNYLKSNHNHTVKLILDLTGISCFAQEPKSQRYNANNVAGIENNKELCRVNQNRHF